MTGLPIGHNWAGSAVHRKKNPSHECLATKS
jgi:hypothetical protein